MSLEHLEKLQNLENLEQSKSELEALEATTYLVFSLLGSRYATLLLSVREVVEYKQPKPLPNTNPAFLGVINIRGEIIGVIDLSTRLGGKPVSSQRPSLLVVDTENGAVATLVESVVSVVNIDPKTIDTRSNQNSKGNSVEGIAQLDSELVTIVDLKSIVGQTKIAA